MDNGALIDMQLTIVHRRHYHQTSFHWILVRYDMRIFSMHILYRPMDNITAGLLLTPL